MYYITRIKKGCYGKSRSLVRSSTLLSRETNNKRTLVLMGYLFTHSISWLNVWVQGDLCDSLGTNCVYCIPCKWFLDEMFYFVTWNWLAYVYRIHVRYLEREFTNYIWSLKPMDKFMLGKKIYRKLYSNDYWIVFVRLNEQFSYYLGSHKCR